MPRGCKVTSHALYTSVAGFVLRTQLSSNIESSSVAWQPGCDGCCHIADGFFFNVHLSVCIDISSSCGLLKLSIQAERLTSARRILTTVCWRQSICIKGSAAHLAPSPTGSRQLLPPNGGEGHIEKSCPRSEAPGTKPPPICPVHKLVPAGQQGSHVCSCAHCCKRGCSRRELSRCRRMYVHCS